MNDIDRFNFKNGSEVYLLCLERRTPANTPPCAFMGIVSDLENFPLNQQFYVRGYELAREGEFVCFDEDLFCDSPEKMPRVIIQRAMPQQRIEAYWQNELRSVEITTNPADLIAFITRRRLAPNPSLYQDMQTVMKKLKTGSA